MSETSIEILEENRRWQIEKSIEDFDGTNHREHLDDIKRINDWYDSRVMEQKLKDKASNYS